MNQKVKKKKQHFFLKKNQILCLETCAIGILKDGLEWKTVKKI